MRLWMLAGVLALGLGPQVGVNALITQLESADSQAVASAATMLKARGPDVVPALLKAMHDNQSCQVQFLLTSVVRDLQPDSPAPNATLLSIAQSRCKMKFAAQEAMYRRQAAFSLASRADGIAAVVTLLEGGEASARRTAALGFADVMKGLATGTPKIELTPALTEAEKTALSALGKALKDSDDYVRCGVYDALADAQKTPSDDLKQLATQLLDGVAKPKCVVK